MKRCLIALAIFLGSLFAPIYGSFVQGPGQVVRSPTGDEPCQPYQNDYYYYQQGPRYHGDGYYNYGPRGYNNYYYYPDRSYGQPRGYYDRDRAYQNYYSPGHQHNYYQDGRWNDGCPN